MRRRRARRRARAATAAARPPRRPRPGPSAPPRTAPHLLPVPHGPTPASSAAPPHTCSRCFHRVPLGAYTPSLYLSLACVCDQGDYDKRTATHLAASEGRWAAVRFLLEEGGADANPLDRWGRHGPTSGRLGGAMSGHHQLLRQTGSEGLGLPSARVRGGRAPQIPPRGHVPGTSPPSTIPIHTAPGHPGGAARRSTTRCAPSTRSSPTTCAPRAASRGRRSGAARRRRRGARVGFASGHETLSEHFVQTKFNVNS